ncbi:MAG: Gldg family protein [Alphaproteobacteria bacterium]
MRSTFLVALRQLRALWAHELRQLATSPATTIFISFTWVAMAVCAFYLGGFFSGGQADLGRFFVFHPWIYLFFLPALAMGAWAEEWKRGTAERLLTLPVHPAVVTLAKYAALLTVLAVVLVGTFPMVGTVLWLGNPAWGPLVTGYVGSFLMGAAMLAVALAASQLSRAQAGGFVLGLLALFVLLAGGWGLLTNLLQGLLPAPVVEALIRFSIPDRFRNFVLGMVDVRDVVFFLSFPVVFLILTHVLLRVRVGWQRTVPYFVAACVAVVGLNAVLMPVLLRFDASPNQQYSLHPTSVEFIQGLTRDMTVTLYSSVTHPQVPAPTKHYARMVVDFLRDVRELNPAHVNIVLKNPAENADDEIQALKHGIPELPLPSGDGYYFGLTFESGGQQLRVPVLLTERANYLEFDTLSTMAELLREKQKTIGIVTTQNFHNMPNAPKYYTELKNLYNVVLFKPGFPVIPPEMDAIIVTPTPYFSPETLYALDQYMVQGGKVMVMLDPFPRYAPEEALRQPDRNADAWAQDHPADYLRHLGVEYDYDALVGDISRAMPTQLGGAGVVGYPLWLGLGVEQIHQEIPFNAMIENVFMAESGYFTVGKQPAGVGVEKVLTTSLAAQTVSRTMLDQLPAQAVASGMVDAAQRRTLAVLATGMFDSMFAGVTDAVNAYYADYQGQQALPPLPPFVAKAQKPGALIAFADSDWLAAEVALKSEPMQGEMLQVPANDNMSLFFNAIQYLLGDDALLPLRGKTSDKRPFTRVEKLLEASTMKHQKLEQQLVGQLFQVTENIQKLRNSGRVAAEEQAQVQAELIGFRKQELNIKKQLRTVRNNLRGDVLRMERHLALLNMLLAPVLLSLAAMVFFWRRRVRARG